MGVAISNQLASAGHPVALFDLEAQAVERQVEQITGEGGQALAQAVDVSDRDAVDAALDKVRTAYGPVAIMVTSAGIDETTPFTEITRAAWDRIIAVNLTGTFNCLQAVVPDRLAGGWGRIVTISSSSAQSGAPRMVHYVASKGGVIGMTKALALELAPHGITVNTIPPGLIDTAMLRRATERGDLPEVSKMARYAPMRRAGTADDVASACAFLCSEDAGFITGQAINVNGGLYL